MTQPVAHGYPDYGRFASTVDKILLVVDDGAASGFPIHGRFFVGDAERLGIIASLSVDNAEFSIEFWSADTGGTQMGGWAFGVRSGSKVDTTVPVAGPWVDVSLNPNGANPTYDLVLYTARAPVLNSVTSSRGNMLCTINQSIGAGAGVTVTSTRIWPGEAHWFCESAVAGWNAQATSISFSGSVAVIDSFRSTVADGLGRQIFLPATNVQLIVNNTSAGAGTFRAAIVARPIETGR